MTRGVLLALKQQGIKMPDDLSLVTFDNEFWYEFVEPPLTVVSQPIKDIATEAAQLMIQLIQGWGAGKPHQIVLQPELIINIIIVFYFFM